MKSKTVKTVLLGVGVAAGVFLVICFVRPLIRGTSFAEEAGKVFNWFLAGLGGIGTAMSYYRKSADK